MVGWWVRRLRACCAMINAETRCGWMARALRLLIVLEPSELQPLIDDLCSKYVRASRPCTPCPSSAHMTCHDVRRPVRSCGHASGGALGAHLPSAHAGDALPRSPSFYLFPPVILLLILRRTEEPASRQGVASCGPRAPRIACACTPKEPRRCESHTFIVEEVCR